MRHPPLLLGAVLIALASAAPAWAQNSQPAQGPGSDWFVPSQGQGAGARQPPGAHPRAGQPTAVPAGPGTPTPGAGVLAPGAGGEPQGNEPQPELPPAPNLPQIAKGASPPAAVIGVLGVQDIMRTSTAAQEVDRVLSERKQKLAEDAKKEQDAWKETQQQITSGHAGLTDEQKRAKETELQTRVTNAQKDFRERDKVIQEAARYSYAQIERSLVAIIREVADSRGMNLILHRPQVALNANEFDITEQVTQELNQVLPSVVIPPDGVEPAKMAQAQTQAGAKPASAPPPAKPPAKH